MNGTRATSADTVVIVGAGLAGGTAATTLREDGFAGRIVLVGKETHMPYERPPLSKGYLQGSVERSAVYLHPGQWYAEHEVEVRSGVRVTSVDRRRREVLLEDGERLPYSQLVLATGSSPRELTVPGSDLDGVHTLRTIEDADRLRATFTSCSSLGIIGGGWIGLEVAAAARQAGLDVTVLELGHLPLEGVLGAPAAQVFTDLHRRHGVDVRTGVTVSGLDTDDGRRVSAVRLAGGEVVGVDAVLVGIGVTPNVELARSAGLTVDGGVLVDEHLRTSDPRVLAAGDVARALHPALDRHLRVDHWANAQRHGVLAARSVQGVEATDDRLPYFYSDQYDLGMEYVGHVDPAQADRHLTVFRGEVSSGAFLVFWVLEGRVAAGMNVNVWDVSEQIERLIRSGRVVDVERLSDPSVGLDDV